MKKYKVDVMINKKIEVFETDAESSTDAVKQIDDKLKAMKISYFIYGAR